MATLALRAGPALAQEEPESLAQALDPPRGPPDLRADTVVTVSGEILAGVLSERVPGDHASLTLEGGEVRRIAWAEIVYAGPTMYAPQLPEPPAPRAGCEEHEPESTSLDIELASATDAPIVFFLEGGPGEQARPICRAPCRGSLPRGVHMLALSNDDGTPVRASPIELREPGVLVGRYVDRSGLRDAGWATLGVGVGVGTALSIVPAFVEDPGVQAAFFIAGAAVVAFAIVLGVILGERGDTAEIRFELPR